MFLATPFQETFRVTCYKSIDTYQAGRCYYISRHARNNFWDVGEVSWNRGTSINVRQKKGPAGKNVGVFLQTEKIFPKSGHFLCKIRVLFSIFNILQGRPPSPLATRLISLQEIMNSPHIQRMKFHC